MIIIERKNAHPDKLRKYKVMLDSKVIGEIANNEKKSFDVSPGEHELKLTIDWATSRTVKFNSTSEPTTFRCVSNITGAKFFLAVPYTTFMRDRYIKLEQVK